MASTKWISAGEPMRPLHCLLLACALVASAGLQAAPKVPVSAFSQVSQYSDPHLSPDGKHIAFVVRTSTGDGYDARMIAIYSLPDMKPAGQIRFAKFQLPTHYQWTGPSRLLIVAGMDPRAPEYDRSFAEIAATDINGGNQTYLYGSRASFAGQRGEPFDKVWNTASFQSMLAANNHLLLTVQPEDEARTYLIDVDTVSASQTRLSAVPAKSMRILRQGNDQPRIAYGINPDAPPLIYHYNDRSEKWVQQNGAFGKLYRPQALSTDGKEVVALYSADGGPAQLIRESLETGTRSVMFSDARGDVAFSVRGAAVGMPFGASTSIGIPAPQYLDGGNEDDKQLHKLLSTQFAGSFVDFDEYSRDGKTILLNVRSDRRPTEYYLFYRDTMRADLLFSVNDKIVADEMGERRPIAFKARDGLDLYGYLTLPKTAAGTKPPLIVLPHDGPGQSDSWFFDTDAQFLASRGYAVLQINFRGSAGRGVNFTEAGYRQWGTKIQDDLVDGLKWTIAQGQVDGARVCTFGTGFGAYSALMLAAREPALIKCAVGKGGFYDLNLLYKAVERSQEKTLELLYGKQIGRDKDELNRYSPITQAERIKAPVLLIHGEKDTVAAIGHATAMRKVLLWEQREPEWLVAPDEGHEFETPANITRFYQKLEEFLGKHIGK
jgi:dipeptidyl aminopeptidase/acylaminoacyl peptidase